jgi:homoserine O-acetyltransferase
MTDISYYSQAVHGPYETAAIGDLVLEDGGTLRDCQLAYATFGTLSAAKDNAILVTTWFSGTSKIMEQAYIGPGRALDPARYFIVVINQIGSGLSTSPHNTPEPGGGGNFPRVRIADDVKAQHRLLAGKFGIEALQLVTGASMGAEQTYEWAVRFPDMVKRAAPIAGTARTTVHTALFARTLVEAITSDPAWNGGSYHDAAALHAGLGRHARLWGVMGASPAMYAKELWRDMGFSSADEFLSGLLEASFLPHDANALLAQAWKWQHADVSRPYFGDLGKALGRITAKTIVLPIGSDMFFTVADCEAEQKLIPHATLRVLQTDWGHLGVMGMDPGLLAQIDAALLDLLGI